MAIVSDFGFYPAPLAQLAEQVTPNDLASCAYAKIQRIGTLRSCLLRVNDQWRFRVLP